VLWFFLSLLFIIIAAWIFIQTPFGQNWLVAKITQRFSRDLNTRIEIKHVDFSLFNKMNLEGVLIEDHERDTLLYAGTAKLRITDWFFFKKNIELKYVGLEDAVIKMQRTDSVWRHQFLIDYFASPSASTKKQGGTNLDIKKLDFKNVVLIKKDAWLGQDMNVRFSSLDLDANEISFSGKTVDLNYLNITDPYVHLSNYPKKKPSVTTTTPDDITIDKPTSIDSLLKWNAAGWVVKAGKLDIKNGTFKNDKYTDRPAFTYFDGKHLEFSKINTTFTNISWQKDTITAHLYLQTKERSGFEVKDMNADVKVTPQEMAFNNLDIRTNNSIIRNFFRMSYDDISSMDNFLHEVHMQGNFNNSEIDSDDIAFFAPALSTWKKNITLKGVIRGKVDDLVGRDLVIQAGHNTLLNGDISMTGLPDIEQTFIDFKANEFRTTYPDAVSFVPAIRRVTKPNLQKLNYLKFNGTFTGFIRDFVTFGTLQTSLGTVKSDLNMKLPKDQPPLYSGTISTDYFRLGDFIGDSLIGIVSLSGSLKGRGFAESNRHADLDGKINFVEYNGYRYHNLAVKGELDKKKFDGMASITDPETELTLNGLIDFNDSIPAFNFLADVKKANLKKLNLTQSDLAFSGKFNLDFRGNNIDNFLGRATIREATLLRNGEPLPFDSLTVSSAYDYATNTKQININSNEFDIGVNGDFNIRDLPDAVKLFLNKYYPTYIQPPHKMPENESLTFDITTRSVDEYIKLIDSSMSGFNNSHIAGKLNTTNNELSLNAEVPQFKYGNYSFDEVHVVAKGNNDNLSVSGASSNISVGDSLNIPMALFSVQARNDSSKVRINTGNNKGSYQASLNAEVLTFHDGVRIEFDPSSFVVNGKTWTIDESGELEFRSRTPVTGQLVLRESNQEIKVRSVPSDTGDWNDLAIELKKVNAGDFTPFIAPRNRLEGLLSGNILIEDPTDDMYVTSDNILIEGTRIDNDSLGNIRASISYDSKTEILKTKGVTLDSTTSLAFDANIYIGADREKQKNNLIGITTNGFQVKILERFLGNLFSDMRGYVTGNFDIKGQFDKLQITGKGRLKNAGLKVNFTQCFYWINDTEIELKPNEIDLNGIVLTDPVTQNPVYLSGDIQHSSFHDMFFNVRVSTRKPGTSDINSNKPVQVLNTTFNDNRQFYGDVKGTGSFSLSGFQTDMFMQIDAISSSRDSSTVTIPSSSNRESGIADFLVERKYGREMEDNTKTPGESNIVYNVDLTVTPNVTVTVIMDDLTGDEIKGRGSGTLNIHSGTNERLTMRGRFDIMEGDYLYTFQSFFPRPFTLKSGFPNYITWNQDPYDAQIHFEAQYLARRVNFAPLVSGLNLDLNQNIANSREDVFVDVTLTGRLFQPEFKFNLDFDANSVFKTNFAVSKAIEQMTQNPGEIHRQVAYLVVFNSFAPPQATQSSGLGSAVNELAYNTFSSLSGILFNEINKKLNTELAKILKTDNISINFSGSVYNRNLLNQQSGTGFGINQSNFIVTVPISMFKDRFVVTLGSNFDVPLQSTIQQSVQFLPDVTAEWLINPSGSIRASFFYKQNLDYLTTSSTGAARNKRSGVSLAYRKEYEGKRKRTKKPGPTTPPIEKPEEEKPAGSN
jgi:hypothetical protein